jgi:hypothetical protein
MCPVCLATVGLYVAGGVSAGGITTYLATRLLRSTSTERGTEGNERGRTPEGRREER